jgi:hypothetical protein
VDILLELVADVERELIIRRPPQACGVGHRGLRELVSGVRFFQIPSPEDPFVVCRKIK